MKPLTGQKYFGMFESSWLLWVDDYTNYIAFDVVRRVGGIRKILMFKL